MKNDRFTTLEEAREDLKKIGRTDIKIPNRLSDLGGFPNPGDPVATSGMFSDSHYVSVPDVQFERVRWNIYQAYEPVYIKSAGLPKIAGTVPALEEVDAEFQSRAGLVRVDARWDSRLKKWWVFRCNWSMM